MANYKKNKQQQQTSMGKGKPRRNKTCTLCGETKPLEDFYKDPKTGKGEDVCKACSYFLGVQNEQKSTPDIKPTDRDTKHRKFCIRCHTWRPTSAFHRSSTAPDGLATTCADCINAKASNCISSTDRNKEGEKYCFNCNTWKPESEYDANDKCKDGLNYYCRECSKTMIVFKDKDEKWKYQRYNIQRTIGDGRH